MLQIKQKQHAKVLAENRLAVEQEKKKERYKFKIGELFLNKFPVVDEIIEKSSKEQFETNIEVIEKIIGSIAECQKSWRTLDFVLPGKIVIYYIIIRNRN